MKCRIDFLLFLLPLSLAHPAAVSHVEFSIFSDPENLNPYGAKKDLTHSAAYGPTKNKMKISYAVNHPSDIPTNQYSENVEPSKQKKRTYQHPSIYNPSSHDPVATYLVYEPPTPAKYHHRQPPITKAVSNAYHQDFSYSVKPKRILLPRRVSNVPSAAFLPNFSLFAKRQNENIGVNLSEALDKSVPFTYY